MLVGCLSFTLIFPFQQQTMKKSSPSIRHEDNWYNCVSKCDITVYFELNNSLINIFHFNRLWFYLNEKPLAIMVSDKGLIYVFKYSITSMSSWGEKKLHHYKAEDCTDFIRKKNFYNTSLAAYILSSVLKKVIS